MTYPSACASPLDEKATLIKHVVMFSGGIGSWAAAKRVVQRYGTDNLVLVFTDTLIEDADLYRFLDDAAANVFGRMPTSAEFVRLADGRTPWEVFHDVRFLGNTRVDPCSKILKRDIANKWLIENCDPENTIVYVGIDWSEEHRFDDKQGGGLKPRYAEKGWTYAAPMCLPPYLNKNQMLGLLQDAGIDAPQLYALKFPHKNCGGFCVKSGQGQFKLLLHANRDLYLSHEQEEQRFRNMMDKNYSIMRDRRGGKSIPMTMKTFRERVEQGKKIDELEYGGCGCFVDD